MVISVETTLQHPKRGFIKLEDTVVVTDTGFDIYGEGARGWNRGGTAARGEPRSRTNSPNWAIWNAGGGVYSRPMS